MSECVLHVLYPYFCLILDYHLHIIFVPLLFPPCQIQGFQGCCWSEIAWAVNGKMKASKRNELVDVPKGKIIVRCKWLFTVKIDQMDLLGGIRHKWLQSVLLERKELITRRHLPQLQTQHYLELLSLVANLNWELYNWMWKIQSLMEYLKKKIHESPYSKLNGL